MRAVLQRVSYARCLVEGKVTGEIRTGILVFLGIESGDSPDDLRWLAKKIAGMRIFSDANDQMNLSLTEVAGNILLISQFTLLAATKKGNRPSFIRAAKPAEAVPLYEEMIQELESLLKKKVETGIFGADMKIELLNDGPVTIVMNTADKDNF
jgi:D-tyrosyl-tRNA(Tyr) deacylase